jgi:hypothetical protein
VPSSYLEEHINNFAQDQLTINLSETYLIHTHHPTADQGPNRHQRSVTSSSDNLTKTALLMISVLAQTPGPKQSYNHHTMSTSKSTASNPPSTEPAASLATTASRSIPSHPAPTDAANTFSGVTADEQDHNAVPTRQIDSDRGMQHCTSWKPRFDRRQSWDQQDQKHALQMTGLQNVKEGPGFTENK